MTFCLSRSPEWRRLWTTSPDWPKPDPASAKSSTTSTFWLKLLRRWRFRLNKRGQPNSPQNIDFCLSNIDFCCSNRLLRSPRRTNVLRMHAYLYGKDLIVMIWFGYLLLFASFSIISFLNAFKCNVIALGIHGQRNSDFYVATKCDFFFQDLNISGKIFKINFLP